MRKLHMSTIIVLIIILIMTLANSANASSFNLNPRGDYYSLQKNSMVIDPLVQKEITSSQEGDQISVIVTLSNQANLSRIPGSSRAVRLEGVIRALQGLANADQRQILSYLNEQSARGNVESVSPFWVFNGLSVTATPEVIENLSLRGDVTKITADKIQLKTVVETAQVQSEPNLSVIQAPVLWNLGYQGQGVVIASLDSGVDVNHPDLVSNWRGGNNSWYDPFGQHPSNPTDLSGHGTWTMGVMVGKDGGGTSIGVAPQSQWIAAKIFDDSGVSTATAIHLAFQWILDPDGNPGTADAPHVVNNSWTFSIPGCNLEFEIDLQSLRAAGILPIFAAGNGGPDSNTSFSPANNPSAFSVGATTLDNIIYGFSSQGPTDCGGSNRVFPDLVAPGVNIFTSDLGGSYTFATGTSLAAPHVSGGLALLLTAFPNLSTTHQATSLLSSAVDLGLIGADNTFGHGRVDLLSAYNWLSSNPEPSPTPLPTPDPTINLALNQTVSVSSSQDNGTEGSLAVDGDLGTYWQTAKAFGKNKLPNEWIQIDLSSESSVGKVILEWNSYYATNYTVQVSNDQTNWTTVFVTTAGDGGRDEISFASMTARYILVDTTSWVNGSTRINLAEVEVYSSGGSQPTSTIEPTPLPSPTPGPVQNLHIGDLKTTSFSEPRARWIAQITLLAHDEDEFPVNGVTISGIWSDGLSGSGSCVTDSSGSCMIEKSNIKGNLTSVRFDITNLELNGNVYFSSANHNILGEFIEPFVIISQP